MHLCVVVVVGMFRSAKPGGVNMSVYRNVHYRADAAHLASKLIGSKNLLVPPWNQLLNHPIESGIEVKGLDYDGNVLDGIESKKFTIDQYLGISVAEAGMFPTFRTVMDDAKEIFYGLQACNKLAFAIYTGHLSFQLDIDWNYHREVVRKVVPDLFTASYVAKQIAGDLDKLILSTYALEPLTFENAQLKIAGLRHLGASRPYTKALSRTKLGTEPWPDIRPKNYFMEKCDYWKIYRCRAATVLLDTKTNIAYFLTGKDITRLSDLCRSYALCYEYAALRAMVMGSSSFGLAAKRTLEYMLHLGQTADYLDTMHLTRGFDCAYHLYLTDLASDVGTRNRDNMMEKILNERPIVKKICDDMKPIISGLSPAEAHDILKLHKAYHVPDYDSNSVVAKLARKHQKPNEILDQALYEEFKVYRKRQFIRTYRAKFGKNPGTLPADPKLKLEPEDYQFRDPNTLTDEQVKALDLQNCLTYMKKNGNEFDFVKDKTCAASTGTWKDDASVLETNYLMYYLTKPHMQARDTILDKVPAVVRVADIALKPEAKKPDSRPFMMLVPELRWVLSETEWNIGEFIAGKNGVFTGRSYADKLKLFSKLSINPETIFANGQDAFLISFDIKSWSPTFPPIVKQDMYDFWHHVTGAIEFKTAKDIFSGLSLRHSYNGVQTEYKINGNDLEGFSGKANTDFHVDMMAFALSKARKRFKEVVRGELGVLIDDGILRVTASDFLSNERIWEIVDYIAKIYLDLGFQISWDKTLVSRRTAIFLNEVIHEQRPLYSGVKTYLRIGPQKLNPLNNFSQEIDEITSMVTGALMSSTHPLIAGIRYIKEVAKTELTWSRKISLSAEFATIRYFTPSALGGIGIQPLLALMANTAYSSETTGISSLRLLLAVGAAPKDKRIIERVLNQDMQQPSARTFMRDPNTLLGTAPRTNVDHGRGEAERIVVSISKGTPISRVFKLADEVDLESVRKKMLANGQINATVIRLWYAASPFSFLDSVTGKFMNSSTIANLIPFRQRLALRRIVKREYMANLGWWSHTVKG